jgi:hypothetical protein
VHSWLCALPCDSEPLDCEVCAWALVDSSNAAIVIKLSLRIGIMIASVAQLVGSYHAISTGWDSRRRRGNPGCGGCGTPIRPIARGVRAASDVAERRDHLLLADSAGVGEWRRYCLAACTKRLLLLVGRRNLRGYWRRRQKQYNDERELDTETSPNGGVARLAACALYPS